MLLRKKPKLSGSIKILLWVLTVQLILLNLSAALYAYKFTHFYEGPPPAHSSSNILVKTWKLFIGPKYFKNTKEAEPPFTYQPVALKVPGQQRIDAWYSGSDSSQKCVLFFHGVGANKSALSSEALWFKQNGYNVLLVDLRGHGKSSGNSITWGFRETEEVSQAFEWARAKGNRTIFLYGCSMGAMVVIKAVADGKVQPAGIIADMPCGSLHDHLRARARVVGCPAEPFASLVTFWVGMENGYNGFNHDVRSYAEKISCPVLLQWGERDAFVTREETGRIFHNLKSPDKKLVVYPEAGHESFLAADPVQWEKEMKSFLGTL